MKKTKSFYLKSKGGNIASVTIEGTKPPSKKMQKALSTLVDLAFEKLKTLPTNTATPAPDN